MQYAGLGALSITHILEIKSPRDFINIVITGTDIQTSAFQIKNMLMTIGVTAARDITYKDKVVSWLSPLASIAPEKDSVMTSDLWPVDSTPSHRPPQHQSRHPFWATNED